MTEATLIRVVTDEVMQTPTHQELVKQIFAYFWQRGIVDGTIRRTIMGVNKYNEMRQSLRKPRRGNDLPVIIETVQSGDNLQAILAELTQLVDDRGQITTVQGQTGSNVEMDDNAAFYDVKLFTREDNKHFAPDHYTKIVAHLQAMHVRWVSVTRGIAGYDDGRYVHEETTTHKSGHLPIVIETVVDRASLQTVLETLKPLSDAGLLFTVPVALVNEPY